MTQKSWVKVFGRVLGILYLSKKRFSLASEDELTIKKSGLFILLDWENASNEYQNFV